MTDPITTLARDLRAKEAARHAVLNAQAASNLAALRKAALSLSRDESFALAQDIIARWSDMPSYVDASDAVGRMEVESWEGLGDD